MWRIELGMTQSEMAKEIGIAQSALSRLESGRSLDPDNLLVVFRWLVKTYVEND